MRSDPILILALMFVLDPLVRTALQWFWRIRHPGVRISILPIQFLIVTVALFIHMATQVPPTYMYMPHQEPVPVIEDEVYAFETTATVKPEVSEDRPPAWTIVPDDWPELQRPPAPEEAPRETPRIPDPVTDRVETVEEAVQDGEPCRSLTPEAADTAEDAVGATVCEPDEPLSTPVPDPPDPEDLLPPGLS